MVKDPMSASLPSEAAAVVPDANLAPPSLAGVLASAGKSILLSKAFLVASLLSVSSILAYEQFGSDGSAAAAADGGSPGSNGSLSTMSADGSDGDGEKDPWADARDGRRSWYPKLGGRGGGGGFDTGGGGGGGPGPGGNDSTEDPDDPEEPLLPGPIYRLLRELTKPAE